MLTKKCRFRYSQWSLHCCQRRFYTSLTGLDIDLQLSMRDSPRVTPSEMWEVLGCLKKKVVQPLRSEAPPAAAADFAGGDAKDQYIADQPIAIKSEDRFNRTPFTMRIAETLAIHSGC